MNEKVGASLRSVIYAGTAFLALSFVATTAHATLRRPAPPGGTGAASSDPSTFNVGAFDLSEPAGENGTGGYDVGGALMPGDNIVHLINPTAANGNLCAMIYMYDDDEEIGECCGCPLSPNKLLSLSVARDLTSNWEVNKPDTDNGVVKIVSAIPNLAPPGVCLRSKGCNGGCDPTQAYSQTPALVGSILKTQTIITDPAATPIAAVSGLTETNMFQEGAPDTTEATNLITGCAFIIKNGSGTGWCSCGPEAE